MNQGCRALIVRGGLLLLVALPFACLILGGILAFMNFGGTCAETADYTLSPEDAERVAAFGYDPDTVAAAASAIPWCSDLNGKKVDLGMLMAIYLSETVGGTTYGTCDGLEASANYSSRNVDAAKELLDRFAKYKIRQTNPVAAQYVNPTYGNYLSHCGAGEMGPGFLPLTGRTICNRYLADDSDPDVASCDFWNPKVFMRAIAATITAFPYGYSSDMTVSEKVIALYSWNHLVWYRIYLVDRAEAINSQIGGVTPIARGRSARTSDIAFGRGPFHDLAVFVYVTFLEPFGLVRQAEVWLDAPFPQGFPREITSEYLDIRVDKNGAEHFHWALDWDCQIGDPIVAPARGQVVEPHSGNLMSRLTEFGTHVWIKHGSVYAVYAHLSEASVRPGQIVKKGQVIGLCGNTGNVDPAPTPDDPEAGSHVHVGVSTKHPDDFVRYYETAPGWTNPHKYFGSCAASK